MPQLTRQQKLDTIISWQSAKPTTDANWAEDVKTESLHVKYDYQIAEMKKSHEAKLPHVQKDLDKFNNWPDAVKFELNEQFSDPDFDLEGKTIQQRIDTEFAEQHIMYKWKVAKLKQSIERINKEKELRASGYLVVDKDDKKKPKDVSGIPENRVRKIKGTVYFIDSDNGNDANDGLGIGAGNAWATLHKFTEAVRSAGDIAILRRGMTNRYDDGGDLAFSSSGTIDNPIIIEADYANAWSDDVDLSATATATLIFGSKTITFSANISGVLSAGDFIYVTVEDGKEFAYEVESVSTVTVTLFLPYKGVQAGSGKAMTNMQSPPIWNIITGSFQWKLDNDNFWKVQGIHIRGGDTDGNVEIDSCAGHLFKDCIFQGDGFPDIGILANDDSAIFEVLKCRFFDHEAGLKSNFEIGRVFLCIVKDCLFDAVDRRYGIQLLSADVYQVEDSEFINQTTGSISFTGGSLPNRLIGRNLILSGSTKVDLHNIGQFNITNFEDFDGVVGDNRQLTGFSTAEGTPTIQSETGTVRSGGSNKSIKVTPSTKLSTKWDFSRIKLFEIPLYVTTVSKTYTIYIRPTATADWTDDPTNTELWLELEAWGHASNNFRKITKSTQVIDMNGSTAWQTLTVTVAPGQAGVAYLRLYYAKTLEGGKTNTFFVDPIPIIS